MKKILFIAAVLALGSTTVSARDERPAPELSQKQYFYATDFDLKSDNVTYTLTANSYALVDAEVATLPKSPEMVIVERANPMSIERKDVKFVPFRQRQLILYDYVLRKNTRYNYIANSKAFSKARAIRS